MIVYVLFFAVRDPTIVTPLDLFTSDDQKYHAWLSLEVIKICCVQLHYFLSVRHANAKQITGYTPTLLNKLCVTFML